MAEHQDHRFALATISSSATADQPADQPAVVTERGVLPLSVLLGVESHSLSAMLADWDRWCDLIASALASEVDAGAWMSVEDVMFGPPMSAPANLYLTGANYHDHIAEMGVATPDKLKDEVFHFMIPTTSLVGDGQDVVRPPGVDMLDWEVELAAVIGRRAVDVKAESALDYVAGYTVANDVSARDASIFHPIFGIRFVFAKGQSTLTPMGPVIVPARFVPDPMHLRLTTHVNDVLRQDSNTEQMIWSLQEQIAYLSSMTALEPGDIILTGTPAGTAAAHGTYLADGDVMKLTIEGIGTLINTVAGTPS